MWNGARLWAMFIGSKCNVRGVKNNNNIITFPLSFTTGIIHYIGKVGASSLHNIQVNYTRGAVNTSNDYLYWSAATVNNAVHEFHDYAAQEGINAPPMGLRVFVNPELPGGAALMMSQFTPIDINNWVTSLNVPPSFTNTYFAIMFNPYTAPLFPTVAVALQSLGPDVIIGTTSDNSDNIKRLVYHEVAHTSHYTNTGKAYWLDLIIAESNAFLATANAHGNATFADADIIAVAESWAEHVALTFSDITYGGNPSFITYPDYVTLQEHRRNEAANHIPRGLYYDLIDGINITEMAGDGFWGTDNLGTIDDNVSGLTNAQLFSLLDNTVTSPTIFVNRLNNSGFITGSNTVQDVNDLFNSY